MAGMERGSDKHAPFVDDQMKSDAEPLERGGSMTSRVEEAREAEPGASRRTRADVPDEELRSRIARWLHRVDYPAARHALIAEARANNAPPGVLDALGRLPEGTTYENVQQIWIALGGRPEERF
jgi:Protein of unknown function (DUF2795)